MTQVSIRCGGLLLIGCMQERIENRREIGTGGEDGLKKVFTGYFSALVAGGKTTGYLSEKGRLTK